MKLREPLKAKEIVLLRFTGIISFGLSCLLVPYRVNWKYQKFSGEESIGYHLLFLEPTPGDAMQEIEEELPAFISGLYATTQYDIERQDIHPFETTLSADSQASNPLDDISTQVAQMPPAPTGASANDGSKYTRQQIEAALSTLGKQRTKITEAELPKYFHDSTLRRLRREAAAYDSVSAIKLRQIDSIEALHRDDEMRERYARIASISGVSVHIDLFRLLPQVLIGIVILALTNFRKGLTKS